MGENELNVGRILDRLDLDRAVYRHLSVKRGHLARAIRCGEALRQVVRVRGKQRRSQSLNSPVWAMSPIRENRW
jgi:hypothetical protein